MTLDETSIRHENKVRIGPISLFTLIAVICLAVLAVLAISSANASLTMAQRQADSVTGRYQNEVAAQEFVACLDEALAQGGVAGVEPALMDARDSAIEAAGGAVTVTSSLVDDVVYAEFTSESGRMLAIEVTIRDDRTYRIDRWKATAVQNEEQPQGTMLIVD